MDLQLTNSRTGRTQDTTLQAIRVIEALIHELGSSIDRPL